MFVVKLGTPSRANYVHFHVYLAYRRQTGTVVTRQTYDRAPRLTRPPTAHISRGENAPLLHISGLSPVDMLIHTLHKPIRQFTFSTLHRFHVYFSRVKSIIHINTIYLLMQIRPLPSRTSIDARSRVTSRGCHR